MRNRRGWLLLVCWVWLGVLGGSARGDTLRLLNGDLMRGTAKGLEGTNLLFDPAWGHDVLEIPAAYAGEITYDRERREPMSSDVRLYFVNGDHVAGRLLEVDPEFVRMRTGWGKELRARREMVSRMLVLPSRHDLLLSGPWPLDQWEKEVSANSPGEIVETGTGVELPGMSSISREIAEFPDQFLLNLRISFATSVPNFHLVLDHEEQTRRNMGALTLMVHGDWVTVRGGLRGRQTILSRAQLPEEVPHTGRVHMQLYGDLGENQFRLVLNDRPFETWSMDPDDVVSGGEGFGIRLATQHTAARVRVEEVALWRYDRFPSEEGMREVEAGKWDQFLLMNGDLLQGELLGFEEEGLRIRLSDGRELAMELGRLRELVLSAQGGGILPRRRDRDVRVRTTGTGDRLTLELLELDDSGLRGRSDVWLDEVVVPVGYFFNVRFNIHHPHRRDDQPLPPDPFS